MKFLAVASIAILNGILCAHAFDPPLSYLAAAMGGYVISIVAILPNK